MYSQRCILKDIFSKIYLQIYIFKDIFSNIILKDIFSNMYPQRSTGNIKESSSQGIVFFGNLLLSFGIPFKIWSSSGKSRNLNKSPGISENPQESLGFSRNLKKSSGNLSQKFHKNLQKHHRISWKPYDIIPASCLKCLQWRAGVASLFCLFFCLGVAFGVLVYCFLWQEDKHIVSGSYGWAGRQNMALIDLDCL